MDGITCTLCVIPIILKNNESLPIFGDIPSVADFPFISYLSATLFNLSFIFMIFICIFLCFEFTKTKTKLKTSYYILIFLGSLTYLVIIILWNYSYLSFITKHIVKTSATKDDSSVIFVSRWYYSFQIGIWNSYISINRATALINPTKYQQFWRIKYMFFHVAIIIVYPFIIDITSFFRSNNSCQWKSLSLLCQSYVLKDQWFAAASTSGHAVLSLLVTVFSLWYCRKNSTPTTTISCIEKRLTFQTLFASIFLIAFSVCELLAIEYFDSTNIYLYNFYSTLSDLFYAIYYYPAIILIFVVSPYFRRRFLSFYLPKKFYPQLLKTTSTQNITVFYTTARTALKIQTGMHLM